MTNYNELIIFTKKHEVTRNMSKGICPQDEYPLFDQFHLCPRARYVGGTDNYLCDCDEHRKCKGVLIVAKLYGSKYWENYNKAKGGK